MDGTQLNIFLSASIPVKERDQKYINTADVIAIRDAVIALTTAVIRSGHKLIWGGHPSITPLVYHVMRKLKPAADRQGTQQLLQNHVRLYQSLFFQKHFPEDNNQFENITFTDIKLGIDPKDSTQSLYEMRSQMLGENHFAAGIFIGGMDGVLDEFDIFRELQQEAIVLPVASTGAAAKILFDYGNNYYFERNKRMLTDYNYTSVFRDLLFDKLDNRNRMI